MKITRAYACAFLVFVCSLAAPLRFAMAELVLSAPPRETPAEGQALYGPLAEHLTKLLATPVVYRHPGNWLSYTHGMRTDAYDIVFDGPQFVAWRIANTDHDVLVKLPGSLSFHVVIRADDGGMQHLDNLAGHKICALAPPNLGTLFVNQQFPNPARQPMITAPDKGGFEDVYRQFMAGKCRAAVLRSQFYDKKLTDEQRAKVKIIATSEPFPDQAISVSRRINAESRQEIIASLTSGDGVAVTQALLRRFAGNAKALVAAKREEFIVHSRLLNGTVFSWPVRSTVGNLQKR